MADGEEALAVEQIPLGDDVSRHIFWPHKYDEIEAEVIWQAAFMFSGEVESVVWRKYKPTIADVHALGCEHEVRRKQTTPDARYRYEGALTASVGAIRAIRTARGFGFGVLHEPGDGQGRHHAEIRRLKNDGNEAPKKADRADLLVALRNVFGALDKHSCARPAV